VGDNVPTALYIAAYADPAAAQGDWDAVKALSSEGLISVHALVLVSRDVDGKIHVKDDAHGGGAGTAIGAAGGLLVGLIFPPSLLVSGVVGGALGGGIGALKSRHERKEIKAEVENVLPRGSSGIVVLFDERWVGQIDEALAKADSVSKHDVDSDSAGELKTAASDASA
jgi:uncharacterized membrane protein